MVKKPNNLVLTFLANKVAQFLGDNPETDTEDAIVEVVDANPKYQKYDWDPVSDRLMDKIAGMVEEKEMQTQSLGKGKAQSIGTAKVANFIDSAPEKLRVKGKANLSVNPDGTVEVEGGKKLGIKCSGDKKPFLEEKEVTKGRTVRRAGCRKKI